jgi:hypothetical protein
MNWIDFGTENQAGKRISTDRLAIFKQRHEAAIDAVFQIWYDQTSKVSTASYATVAGSARRLWVPTGAKVLRVNLVTAATTGTANIRLGLGPTPIYSDEATIGTVYPSWGSSVFTFADVSALRGLSVDLIVQTKHGSSGTVYFASWDSAWVSSVIFGTISGRFSYD